ncbi:MAG: acetone carboxylase subunit gamma, partial [Candidatus Binatia bacterium]
SRFRNLLHRHVHQEGAGPATTFWAGLGAIRREAFERVGGFDALRRLGRGTDVSRRSCLPAGDSLPNNVGGVRLAAGEAFVFACAAGGGLGDPLERDPVSVERDLGYGYISAAQTRRVYGVVLRRGKVDAKATEARRAEIREERLARSKRPARTALGKVKREEPAGALGLTVGVQRQGKRRRLAAFCARCRHKLALAPADWKTGAAIAESHLGRATARFLVAPVAPRNRPRVIVREFFCPACATLLESEVVLEGTPIAEDVRPDFYALPA